jgi:hypothetical protein
MNNLAKQIIEEAIDEINADQDASDQIDKSSDTPLLSASSNVDSLALVRLLIAVERLIEEKTGKSVIVVDESAFEAEQSPFTTVGALERHIETLLA